MMGIGKILPSIHKNNGWRGQYSRMKRWYHAFLKTDPGNFENHFVHEEHDVLYACFQNIFFLKDWLHSDGSVDKKKLNNFIEQHLEMKLCRDLCNGTKHFKLNDPSVDVDFTIIREYQPQSEVFNTNTYHVIVLGGGHKFELKSLAKKCIELWDFFIRDHGL